MSDPRGFEPDQIDEDMAPEDIELYEEKRADFEEALEKKEWVKAEGVALALSEFAPEEAARWSEELMEAKKNV